MKTDVVKPKDIFYNPTRLTVPLFQRPYVWSLDEQWAPLWEDIVRLILDGTVIKTRLDRKATNISVLAAIGVCRDGQKVLISIKNMGGESTAAWSQFLTDLDARGLRRPRR